MKFVVVAEDAVEEIHREADDGGKQFSGKSVARRLGQMVGIIDRPVEDVEKELEEVMKNIQTILKKVSTSPVGEMKLEGMEVGISITGEGSIGVATVGAEASITLSFTKA